MPLSLVAVGFYGYGNTCQPPVLALLLALLSLAACFLISAAWAAEPTDTSHIQGDRGNRDFKGCGMPMCPNSEQGLQGKS